MGTSRGVFAVCTRVSNCQGGWYVCLDIFDLAFRRVLYCAQKVDKTTRIHFCARVFLKDTLKCPWPGIAGAVPETVKPTDGLSNRRAKPINDKSINLIFNATIPHLQFP